MIKVLINVFAAFGWFVFCLLIGIVLRIYFTGETVRACFSPSEHCVFNEARK